ncbi:hypothetical protein Tco_0795043 [Tanacetum coccineum]
MTCACSIEKSHVKNDVKGIESMLMALPNEHHLPHMTSFKKLVSRWQFLGSSILPSITLTKVSQLVHDRTLEQLHDDDLEEMDLKWNMALLSMRARNFYQRNWKENIIDGKQLNKDAKIEVLLKATTYKRGLATLEGQIVKYKEHEVLFSEEIALLKRSVGCKEYELGLLRTELGKVKQEKEGVDFKIAKDSSLSLPLVVIKESDNSSDNTDGLLETTSNRTLIPETSSFKSPLKVDKDWKEKFFYPANHVESVNQIEKPVKRTVRYADKSLVSDNEDEVESPIMVEKKTVVPNIPKVYVVRPKQQEKPVRKIVRYAEMYRSQRPRGNQRNWNNQKSQ